MNFRFKSKSRQMEVDAFHSMENGTLSPFFPMREEKVLNKALLQDEEEVGVEDGDAKDNQSSQMFFFFVREICLEGKRKHLLMEVSFKQICNDLKLGFVEAEVFCHGDGSFLFEDVFGD